MSELTEPAPLKHTVTYDITYTKNMGNFESVKVTVGLSQEGHGGRASKDELLSKVREWVEEHLSTAISEVSQALEAND